MSPEEFLKNSSVFVHFHGEFIHSIGARGLDIQATKKSAGQLAFALPANTFNTEVSVAFFDLLRETCREPLQTYEPSR